MSTEKVLNRSETRGEEGPSKTLLNAVLDLLKTMVHITTLFVFLIFPVLTYSAIRDLHPLSIAAALALSIVVGSIAMTFFIALLRKALIGNVPIDGVHKTIGSVMAKWGWSVIFADAIRRGPFWFFIGDNSLLAHLFYRSLGGKISQTAFISAKADVPEPWAVSIGPASTLGDYSLVLGHEIVDDELTLAPVSIGRNVTIGARAIILPGTVVGDGAIVAAGAVVPKNTRIGGHEVWGGVPAQRIASRDSARATEE